MNTPRRNKRKFKYVLIGPIFVETDHLQFYLVAKGCRQKSQQQSWG